MPAGRPKITVKERLPEGWQDKVLALMAEGGSDVEVMAMLDISDDLWYRWLKEEEEFSQTIKKGDKLCKAWWLQHGRKQLTNKEFSPVLWYMNMKNRFGWKDKQDITSNDKTINIQVPSEIANKHDLTSDTSASS